MYCPNCGAEYKDGAKFCNKCGSSLTVKKCLKCGFINEDDALFCSECGNKLCVPLEHHDEESTEANTPVVATEPKREVQKINTKDKLSRIFSKIIRISSIVVLAMVPLLFFAPFATAYNEDGLIYQVNNFTFFEAVFSADGFTTGNSVYAQILNIGYGNRMAFYLIAFVGYYASVLTFVIMGIIRQAKALKRGVAMPNDISLIYVVLITLFFSSLVNSGPSMGAGTQSIAILGCLILMLDLIYRLVFTFDKNKGYCFASIVCLCMVTFHFLSMAGSSANQYYLITTYTTTYVTSANGTLIEGAYYMFYSLCLTYRNGYISNVSDINNGINYALISAYLSFAILIACFVLALIFIKNLFTEKKKIGLIIYPSIILALSIIACVVNAIILTIFNTDSVSGTAVFTLGTSQILLVIYGLLCLGGSIAAYILRGKAKDNVYHI